MTSNNPLKQYFRRPSVYLALPSKGQGYSEATLERTETGELPVYPMTAIDEITARTPDALFNGSAVTDLIKSCVPSIKDPWEINSNDLDAILIAIRAASGGDKMEIDSKCPKCEETSTFEIQLIAILASLQASDYSKILELGDLKFKFKPLTFREMNQGALAQFEVQKSFSTIQSIEDEKKREEITHKSFNEITMLTMDLLSKTIEYVETPTGKVEEQEFILDFLKHCDKNTFNGIRDFNNSLKESTQLKPVDIKCPDCGHEYKQDFVLNPTDFFG